jgi:selenide,water dikinase
LTAPGQYRLTQYSHGAGCGCKISPAMLDDILHHQRERIVFPGLLVGNDERDDAAVLDLGDGSAVISTTDFFMPIVDDARDFGRIASVNAISDVYAMGGRPLLAIAILGWPVSTLPPAVANEVVEGARDVCAEAGIPLAGGHSIDSPEPIFGLAVTGRVQLANLKKNAGGRAGDRLYLTKPLGVGILTTAQKHGVLRPEHAHLARDSMCSLNRIGEDFGDSDAVRAMTDVTGFGLLGHLSEMCEASGVSARIEFDRVELLDRAAVLDYLARGCVPGGSGRNWASYGHKVQAPDDAVLRQILTDPQTSGGLLCAVDPERDAEFRAIARAWQLDLEPIGELEPRGEALVRVVPGRRG